MQKAAKDYPEHGIRKGEPYYWWKFRYGGKRFSKTAPKRSQLTQSSFYATVYDIEDEVIGKAVADDSLPGVRDDVVSQLEDLKSECESNLDNIPDSLKDGSSGQLLQERIDALDNAIREFEDLELNDFEATKGSEVLEEQKETEGEHEGTCGECHEGDYHVVDCSCSDKDEAVNDDDQTEQQYWEAKLEEFTGISIEAP